MIQKHWGSAKFCQRSQLCQRYSFLIFKKEYLAKLSKCLQAEQLELTAMSSLVDATIHTLEQGWPTFCTLRATFRCLKKSAGLTYPSAPNMYNIQYIKVPPICLTFNILLQWNPAYRSTSVQAHSAPIRGSAPISGF